MDDEQPDRRNTIDLFCGAGGLVLGLQEAGFTTSLAVDNWGPAVATLRANFVRTPVADVDLADATGASLLAAAHLDAPPSLIAGGPPCQGFSSAGSRRNGDHRNSLVSKFGVLVAELMPSAFLFENVEGFLTAEGGGRVFDLLDPVIEAGYHVQLRKINAANYGVPQLRKRVIGIGTLGGDPPFPPPTHTAFGAPGAHRVPAHDGMPKALTIRDALRGLPAPGSTDAPPDHVSARVNDLDRERIRALKPGQTMRDLPEHLHHESYRRRASRRVKDGTPTERRGGAPAGIRRLVAEEPSKAITSAGNREFIHPSQDRPLTLRECARLQTFPDSFSFEGTASQKALLVGNAVPPLLAAAVGRALLGWLEDGACAAADGSGRLVTFQPTLADGMSPALQALTTAIRARYGALQQQTLWP
jgi:DNA (cytosine-5)-methyltransferase 1